MPMNHITLGYRMANKSKFLGMYIVKTGKQCEQRLESMIHKEIIMNLNQYGKSNSKEGYRADKVERKN